MDFEIEKKFLVKSLPDLSGKTKQSFERYYLFIGKGVEIRIQRVDDKYKFERKVETSNLERITQKFEVTKGEFESLKEKSGEVVLRDSYLISENPVISLKIYHGRFEGLVRAEVEFESEEDAVKFIPLGWMGKEITDSALGRDSTLTNLSDEEFKALLNKQNQLIK